MNQKLSAAVIHGLKVGAHIATAIVFVGVIAYLDKSQSMFVSYLASFGVPVSVANIVFASVYKYLKAEQQLISPDVSNDIIPPANIQQ